MAAMDVNIGTVKVGTCLNYTKKPTAQKVINISKGGSVYAQQTGKPVKKYEVAIFCPTKENRDAIDTASNECIEITLESRDATEITGIIEDETIEWKEWEDGHGVGTFVLIEE